LRRSEKVLRNVQEKALKIPRPDVFTFHRSRIRKVRLEIAEEASIGLTQLYLDWERRIAEHGLVGRLY